MTNEVEAYPGELKELRSKVSQLENELMTYKPQETRVRVSGVPYEVYLKQQENLKQQK
jgi:hypothetical protein